MCYSAMIEESYREYCRMMHADLDWGEWLRLFHAREKELSLKIPSGIGAQLVAAGGPEGREIERCIAAWRPLETQRLQAEVAKIEARLVELSAKKPSKTTNEKLASGQRNLVAKQQMLTAHTSGVLDYRMWPGTFAPVLAEIDGRRVITPMRYKVIPRHGPELSGLYNARRDSLFTASPWRPIFGRLHGVFFYERFFESVTRSGVNTEITFRAEGHDRMWSPALYEETPTDWGIMRTFAIITDDPPPEISAAGHDRCPIFLDFGLIDQWLHPVGQSLAQLDALLSHREPTYYSHALAA